MENSHQSTDGKMRDFCDGEYYKEHPLFSIDKTALQLFLYYDDFEICNPLGSRVKKQKIGRCLCFHCSASVMKGLYITRYNKLSHHAILSTNKGRMRGFLRSNFKLISLPSICFCKQSYQYVVPSFDLPLLCFKLLKKT